MIRLSGRFRSALIIGLQGIRSRKTRTLLSMVSLFLGVLAVVVVQAAASMAEQVALADIELQSGVDGTLRGYVQSSPEFNSITFDTVKGRSDVVALMSVQAVIGEPNVDPINPGASPFDVDQGNWGGGVPMYCDNFGCRPMEPSQMKPKGQAIELRLTAMTGDIRTFRPFRTTAGQWLDFSSEPSLGPRIVVNEEAAKGFAMYQVPAEMRVSGAPLNSTPRIIGVVEDGSTQPTAYMRTDELLNWLPVAGMSGASAGASGSRVSAGGFYAGYGPVYEGGMELMLSPTAMDVATVLEHRLTGAGMPQGQWGLEPIRSREEIETTLAVMRWIFLGLAGLVLLIGVAGILNVGLATVGERVEEFALRRAVGTPRLLLAGIVLAETLLTGLLTAAAAIGVAAGAVSVAGQLFAGRGPLPQTIEFPWQAAVAGVVAGLIAGVLGGLIPALRAARIPIATVMRA